ncbi:GIY-YIG nuclease family protein [Desulfitobacterium sp.]|uniref:GIY-YIG nuclease family protein n=1 Tax=Desulfitobacterium sp. TaxID=49981 RepID=UPI002B1F60DC|nr:GIY-YIG nuclease family protein [Desulfitobacterium sp.]MEA4900552.1 GIY-YIG nuclease family protein [Desulfitobacterium sp.]
MAMRGKSINLFLMDGEPGGRIKCTLANWTGVAYKIPRTALDLCKERDDLKQSGVYFLFGTSDQTGNNVVYIGQAGARKNGEGLLYRLLEHKRNPDKDYWTEAIVFTTSNNSFGPTEISYLENRFCGLAFAAKRYDVKNGNDPTHGNITEEKESELEEFVDYARIVMGTLGHRVFEPVAAVKPTTEVSTVPADEPLLYFNRTNLKATGRRTSEGFVVLKGSAVVEGLQKSCPENAVKLRERYKDKINADHILTEDILFSSPSAAAAFVGGASLSGNELWKTSDGISLKNLD